MWENTEETIRWLEVLMYYQMLKSIGYSVCVLQVSMYFNNRLLRGNRSTKVSSTRFDAYDSPNVPPLVVIGINTSG